MFEILEEYAMLQKFLLIEIYTGEIYIDYYKQRCF